MRLNRAKLARERARQHRRNGALNGANETQKLVQLHERLANLNIRFGEKQIAGPSPKVNESRVDIQSS